MWNGIRLTDFISTSDINVDNFVFVTAASNNHFDESRDLIASVQTHMPHHKILFYDLQHGYMSPERADKVGGQGLSMDTCLLKGLTR